VFRVWTTSDWSGTDASPDIRILDFPGKTGEGGDLMLWIMGGPAMHHIGCKATLDLTGFQDERGTVESATFKSKYRSLDFWEEKHGQNH
jgi:hypothetical protein